MRIVDEARRVPRAAGRVRPASVKIVDIRDELPCDLADVQQAARRHRASRPRAPGLRQAEAGRHDQLHRESAAASAPRGP